MTSDIIDLAAQEYVVDDETEEVIESGDLVEEEEDSAEPVAESELNLPPLQVGVVPDPLGRPVVLLTIATPFGPQTYPLGATIARKIGAQLQQTGSEVASPLTVAKRPGLIIPGR